MSIIRYHQEQYSMARSINPFKTTTVTGSKKHVLISHNRPNIASVVGKAGQISYSWKSVWSRALCTAYHTASMVGENIALWDKEGRMETGVIYVFRSILLNCLYKQCKCINVRTLAFLCGITMHKRTRPCISGRDLK